MSNNTLNPGLLYSRFYFDERYNDFLDQQGWFDALKADEKNAFDERMKDERRKYDKDQSYKKKDAQREGKEFTPEEFLPPPFQFVPPTIGGFRPEHLLHKPKGKEATPVNNHFALRNHQLFATSLSETLETANRSTFHGGEVRKIELTTTYPGLLIGLGYNHQVTAEAAINGGFSFDHTTGLPVIPGPSVKGILRAAFPGQDYARAEKDKESEQGWYTTIARAKKNWLHNQLGKLPGLTTDAAKVVNLTALETELFASTATPYAQPCFYDALIVEVKNNGPILGPDNITPHLNRRGDGANIPPARYHNPTPISFLKVMPGVSFSFAFRPPLPYRTDNGEKWTPTLNAGQLEALFRAILLEYGAGAKTRLNYGRFEATGYDFPSADKLQSDRKAFEDDDFKHIKPSSSTGKGKPNRSREESPGYAVGDSVVATVFKVDEDRDSVGLSVPNQRKPIWAQRRWNYGYFNRLQKGDKIDATVRFVRDGFCTGLTYPF